MATIKKQLVSVPDDIGIVVKTAGKKREKYVYKQTRFYRSENGQPRNDAVGIGKFDTETGKMFPNAKYFELFNVHPNYANVLVEDFGYSFILRKCAQDLGLLECLDNSFGETAEDILAMAAYMIREGNAMDGIDDWLERNYFPNLKNTLTSQNTSRIFASLSYGARLDFFREWVKKSLTNGCVCYDVTSISSYSEELISVERGYNRDGDDLSQFNLGMFCDEISKIPLYYNRYNGSLTDKSNLACVLKNAKNVGIRKVKMVLDGGFWSEDALINLNATCTAFTVGMPAYLTESETAIDKLGGSIKHYSNELRNHQTYCAETEAVIYGICGKILLFYDAQNNVTQNKSLSELIERQKAQLSALKRYPTSKEKHFMKLFKLTKHTADSRFDFDVDVEKIEMLRAKNGFFLLFSTDMTGKPDDILDYYRAKDADEKIFAQIKIDMDGNRIRTHNEETTDGKTFVTFIACVLRSHMLRKLSGYLTANSTSMKKVLNRLSNIMVIAENRESPRLIQALTKQQKDILNAFDSLSAFNSTF